MDEDLFDLSDEELEQAFKAAKAEEQSPDVGEELEETEEVEPEVEQPDEEDSDEDEGEEEAEEVEDKESAEEETDPDEGDKPEVEETEESTEEVTEEPIEVQKYKFKANGKEYEFTEQEIKEKFPAVFGQAMDYTRKMQAIKPWRKTIDAIESAKLTHEDVNLMIDVLKGDKHAIAEVLKKTGVDSLDLDVEQSKYTPNDYGRDEKALEIHDVLEEIKQDPEYTRTSQVLGKEWDDASWQEMSGNPKLIKALHIDMKNGMYDKVQPIAEKLKLYEGGGKSDLEYYKEASRVLYSQMRAEEQRTRVQEEQVEVKKQKEAELARVNAVKHDARKQADLRQASVKRKAAAPTMKTAGRKSSVDYLEDSEEAFEQWYKQLQDRM